MEGKSVKKIAIKTHMWQLLFDLVNVDGQLVKNSLKVGRVADVEEPHNRRCTKGHGLL